VISTRMMTGSTRTSSRRAVRFVVCSLEKCYGLFICCCGDELLQSS
jgi:hypothetical protein